MQPYPTILAEVRIYPGVEGGGLQLIFQPIVLSGSLFTWRPYPQILVQVTIALQHLLPCTGLYQDHYS